jgi:2-polyprenyl-3-methyl-5-hydroxy-6-metoxy-1,4-benzoquinol methylase
MPGDQEIVAANRSQTCSETDSFTPQRYHQFYAHFPRDTKTVLDVGCNTGRGGQVLKTMDASLKITGLDLVPERIAILDRAVYTHAICGSSTAIPAEDGSFDVIVGGELVEHLPPGQVDTTLAEFFRLLRLNGRLLLTTPNPKYLKNRLKHLSVLLGPSHLSQHFADCLSFRMRSVGFSKVKVFGSGRVSRYLGQRFPLLSIYGSYLIRGDKW